MLYLPTPLTVFKHEQFRRRQTSNGGFEEYELRETKGILARNC